MPRPGSWPSQSWPRSSVTLRGWRKKALSQKSGVLCQAAQVKHTVIKQHESQFTVRLMCRVLSESPSCYYAWWDRSPSQRALAQQTLDAQVREAFHRSKGRDGALRLSLGQGRRQVAGSLGRQGLRAKAARKFKATTNSNHTLPMAENLLKQDPMAQRPNQAWVADITYIGTEQGWLYLAVVLDLFSRKGGWCLSG